MKKENTNDQMYELCEKIVTDVNDFHSIYITDEGKFVPSREMIMALNVIIEEGFVLYKHVIENKLYEGKPEITVDVLELEKYIKALEMTEENAKRLDLQSAFNSWKSCEVVIAKLACDLLDFRDGLN